MRPKSTWRVFGFLAGFASIILALSCVGGGGHHNSEGGMEVFNDGNVPMTQLFVTRSVDSSWGVDQLAPSTLSPGDSLTLTQLNTDYYDVRAHFSDGSSDEVFDVLVLDGFNVPLSMRNSGNGTLDVFNNSAFTLNGVYVTPSSSSTWGPNQADLPIAPGQTLSLTGISPATYDLRVVFAGGATLDFKAVEVSSGAVTTVQVN